jgi:lipopolysaccharide export system protein LptA
MRPAPIALVSLALLITGSAATHIAYAATSMSQTGFGTSSKEPIQIDADSLEVFDQEQRAVYKGNVIVKQGETTMKAAKVTVYYDRRGGTGISAKTTAAPTPGSSDNTALKKVEAEGGVAIFSRDQVATGERGIYDRATDIITLSGNVTLSKGQNVTRGQRLVYNVGTGIATMEAGSSGGRVSSSFAPSDQPAAPKNKTP